MTATQLRLSHGSTPLTMTFHALGAALADLLGQPQDICHAQMFVLANPNRKARAMAGFSERRK
jgi:hypothetical protein